MYVEEVEELFGTLAKASRLLGYSSSGTVYNWRKGKKCANGKTLIPEAASMAIHIKTGGKLKHRFELYGKESKKKEDYEHE